MIGPTRRSKLRSPEWDGSAPPFRRWMWNVFSFGMSPKCKSSHCRREACRREIRSSTCPNRTMRNFTKQLLRVRGSVWDSDSIRAGTARRGNSETRAFDAISTSSVQRRGLFHVTAQALFRQGSNVVVS